jgi:uncharacterized phiE125 gp8 family phage protein
MYLFTPPATEPVTLAEAKVAARVDDSRFDSLLPGFISAARAMAEQETGRQFMAQTWRTDLEDWPAADATIHVHRATAAAVTYWNGSAFVSLAGSGYVYHPLGNGTALVPAIGAAWPELGAIAGGPRVRIDLTAGAASAADVPEGVKTYIKALVVQMLESPSLAAASVAEANPLLGRLLDPYRLWA